MSGDVTDEAVRAHLADRGLPESAYAEMARELMGGAPRPAAPPTPVSPELERARWWQACHHGQPPPSTWGW
jgi:hypothetical protein